MKYFRSAWTIFITTLVMISSLVVYAQVNQPRHLIASGGGFAQPQDTFFRALENRVSTSDLKSLQILVLPVGMGSNPNSITDAERTAQLADAEQQRQELEADCQANIPPEVSCSAILVPVITNKDAQASPSIAEFSSNPDGIYFLQSDARSILEVLRGTKLEKEIANAYQAGTILSGSGNLFSRIFIQGYRPKFGPARVLTFGAILTDQSGREGGIAVFPEQAVVDTLPFSENRFGRLLNAISGSGAPHLGLGIENATGFELIDDDQIEGVFGESVVTVLDAETYQSANRVIYQPGTNLISIKNVVINLIGPGDTTYSLLQRTSSLGSTETSFSRDFDSLLLPPGSGNILLTSNLLEDPAGMDALIDFTNISGGQNANLLILAVGYSDGNTAELETGLIRQKLAVPNSVLILSPDIQEPIQIDEDITGIILTGPEPSTMTLDGLMEIKNDWLSGLPILADRAGASILGLQFPSKFSPEEDLPPFSPGRFQLQPGLGFIQANIEPEGLRNSSWERMLTTAYLSPLDLSIGISPGADIHFTSESVSISGYNIVSMVDFRNAQLAAGSTGAYQVSNGIIDVYTPGESIRTIQADSQQLFIHAPTPVLETIVPAPNVYPTPTILPAEDLEAPTEAPREKPPTRTPRPTGTPIPTPPPSDPGTTNLMVFFGVLSVVVVIVGVWLNRQIAVE